MKEFKTQEFVIFDVETTGLSTRGGDRIIEIAAVKINGLQRVNEFHSLINPGRPVSYGAFLVNGISDEMLCKAPRSEEVIPSFLEFIEGTCLIAHNIKFDVRFLNNELLLMGAEPLEHSMMLDTLTMSRGLLPEIHKHSLLSVAHFLDVGDKQQHRAMADVELTFKVFLKMLEIADRRDICEMDTLMDLYGYKQKTIFSGERH